MRQSVVTVSITVLVMLAIGYTARVEGGAATPPLQAAVIELTITGHDTIPLRSHAKLTGRPYEPAWVEKGVLHLHPEVASTLTKRLSKPWIQIDRAIKKLDDIKVVILTRTAFTGSARQGTRSTIALQDALPPFPIFNAPNQVVIGPFRDVPPLKSVIPLPEATWRISDDDAPLSLQCKGEDLTLNPGDAHVFDEQALELPVVRVRFKPVRVGENSEPELEELPLGKVAFTTKLTVTFHGRLPMKVAP